MPKLRPRNVVHVIVFAFCVFASQHLSSQQLPSETILVGGRMLPVLSGRLLVRMRSVRTIAVVDAMLPAGFHVDGQLLDPVRTEWYRSSRLRIDDSSASAMHQLGSGSATIDLRSAEDRLTRTFTVSFTGLRSVSSAIATLTKSSAEEIELVEPWYINAIGAAPNDPLMMEQTYLQTIRLAQTWDVFRGSDTITIGISDDGVSQSHEDLAPNIAVNSGEIPDNGVDDDGNGYVDDHRGYNFTWQLESGIPGSTTSNSSFGHGTKVAGIAAAATDNGLGVVGAGLTSRFFPMKTALKDGGGIVFGYQSLIYAAQRGFDVVNCSWGLVKPESAIDQSVIDYCLAKGTVVVASAGNHGDDAMGSAFRDRNFPASYDGVIGVGETTPEDFVVSSSGLARNSRIMAPGNGAYTTDAGGSYGSNGVIGTSFASPIVAGVAAVVRARWPQLTPRQVAAHLCRTADDITMKNNAISEFLSPRVNMLRAVTTEPLSRPFMHVATVRQRVSSGSPWNRFRAGDTLLLEFGIVNDLAPGAAEVETKIVDANGWILRVLRERDDVGVVGTGSTVWSRAFPCVVEAIGTGPCVMRIDIVGDSAIDRDWYYVEPPAGIAQFANDSLIYSMADDGMVGYTSVTDQRQGDGFGKKPSFQLLSPSGFFMVDASGRSVSAFKNDPPYASDFVSTKRFDVAPDATLCRMMDEATTNPIGVVVSQNCAFPAKDQSATIWTVTLTPRLAAVSGLSAGYMLDWDIGTRGRSNRIATDAQALPASLRSKSNAAQTITRQGFPVAVCVAAISEDPADVAQSAGFLYSAIIDDADGFTHADRVRLLTSGTDISESGEGDISGVIGMLRKKPLAVGESWTFRVVITVGADDESARELMRKVLASVSVRSDETASAMQISPNPVIEKATLSNVPTAVRFTVIDQLGRTRLSWRHDGTDEASIETATLEKGAYSVLVELEDHSIHTLRFVR